MRSSNGGATQPHHPQAALIKTQGQQWKVPRNKRNQKVSRAVQTERLFASPSEQTEIRVYANEVLSFIEHVAGIHGYDVQDIPHIHLVTR